jgi:D-beta-D-heptose 7-phosphate kinase/D-beta-D-heptose 1-phosphate adenosyltransferase
MKIVLVTGGFDPLHSGHIKYFEEAKKLGDQLIIGLNSDDWLTRKKGRPFMKWEDRLAVIRNIRGVNWTVQFDDSDGTAKDAIRKVRLNYPNDTIIFANGGDRTKDNIPEMGIKDNNLEFVFGVGGENKRNSSRWILEEWKSPKTERPWGNYRVLYESDKTLKLKELTVDPGRSLSMQKHEFRSEFWFVSQGYATVYTLDNNNEKLVGTFGEHQSLWIPKEKWHRSSNETDSLLKLIEIQYGTECTELDIIRK